MASKGFSYGIAGVVGMAMVIATILMNIAAGQMAAPTIGQQSEFKTTSGNMPSNSSSNTGTTADPKAGIEQAIANAVYYTFSNATTPSTAVDPRTGTVYVAYFRDDHDNQNGTLYVQRSDDGGQTFLEPVRVNDKNGEASIEAQWSAPAMAVGPNGEVYLAWYHADMSDPGIYGWGHVYMRFARSLDGGQTFEPSFNPAPNDPIGEQSYPYMVVSNDNNVHISYLNLDYSKEQDNSGTPTEVRIVSSHDGGQTFQPSVVADPDACQCCATVEAIDLDGEVYASSRSVFLETVQALTNETRTDYQSGDLNQTVIRDITVYGSTDNGQAQNFTQPSRVGNDDWYMNGCPDAGPGMAFDSQDRMHVAWFTGSETASQGQGFYYTHSDDKGQTFSTPVPIHLISEQWIPPTTQYLVSDAQDNSWIVFVNSEGLDKGADYEETYEFEGQGFVHLAVVDRDGNILRNGPFATGDITKHYPYTSEANGRIALSWMDGESVKLAVMDTAA